MTETLLTTETETKTEISHFNENFVFVFCKKASFLLQINYIFVYLISSSIIDKPDEYLTNM